MRALQHGPVTKQPRALRYIKTAARMCLGGRNSLRATRDQKTETSAAWPFLSAGWRAFSPGQNYLLSATVGPTVNESIVHLSVAFWQFPPRDDGLLRNRQKSEVAMEPTRFHRMLQSVMTRRPRKVTSLVRPIEVHPQIAVYGSQRMCRSCGAITARAKPFCLECGELLPAA